MNKKVVLISLDALSDTEFDRLKKQDNFGRFIKDGAYSKNSLSVYPTQTYTVHTSVITGNYPDKHGVYNNQYLQPFVKGENKEWFWYRHQVKTNTLYDAIRQNGKKACSILWPVTAKAKIRYNIPEMMAINNENQAVKVLRNSSMFFAVRNELKYGKVRKGISQPWLDEFAKRCTVDAIKRHSPDLVMVHLVAMDAAKHHYGVESQMVDKTIKVLDRMIGEIMEACGDEYTIVIFSDHGQFTIEKDVHINAFLQQHGLLSFKNKTYDAYVECMGGSGAMRAKDEKSLQKAIELIDENKDMLGIEEIYKRDMLDKLHVGKDIECMVEAKTGYHLKEGYSDKIIRDLKEENRVHATHGYSPMKDDYRCVFFAMGEGIEHGKEIGEMEVVDIAPTIARIMGIDNYDCDGKVLSEIFKK